MKILLVYPEIPLTFWSFKNAVRFISKKASEIPLGLLTVAAMLPDSWEKKLIDVNVSPLKNKDILWADFVFISGMNIQINSFNSIIKRCNQLGVKVVAGGPTVTTDYKMFQGVDHFVLNEAEGTISQFISDLENGCPKYIYSSDEFPDLSLTPIPQWDLLKMNKYATMSIQYSRGCPYDCEFCSITMLNGRRPRIKSKSQFIGELDALYQQGWRGSVFIVDDNFIGNKKILKQQFLPALINWMEVHDYPFYFTTEVSINLADDIELIKLMIKAGFRQTFVGIETPNSESLLECGKSPNISRDMEASVRKLQRNGLMVSGGFIVGFDHDTPSVFEQQIEFIQKTGLVVAMVGLLNAPSGTRLFKRLKSENRLLDIMSGDNMDGSMNFIPKMKYQNLIMGYKKILDTIYSSKEYYKRVKKFLQEYQLPAIKINKITITDMKAFFKSVWVLGMREKGRHYYWKLIFYSLFRYPEKFALAVTMAIYGYHFRKVVENI